MPRGCDTRDPRVPERTRGRALDVLAEESGGERASALESGQAAIVPRGVWHRLAMRRPGRLLVIDNRKGIQSRPFVPTREEIECSPI